MNGKAKEFKKDLLLKLLQDNKDANIEIQCEKWNIDKKYIEYHIEENDECIIVAFQNLDRSSDDYLNIFYYTFPYEKPIITNNENDKCEDLYKSLFAPLLKKYKDGFFNWCNNLKNDSEILNGTISCNINNLTENGASVRIFEGVNFYNEIFSISVDFERHCYKANLNQKQFCSSNYTATNTFNIYTTEPIDFIYQIAALPMGIAELQNLIHITVDDLSNNNIIEDFIYKIEETDKFVIITEYENTHDFFENDYQNNIDGDTLIIMPINSKDVVIEFEKSIKDDKIRFKFIVKIVTKDEEEFYIKNFIDTKEQLKKNIKNTVEALKQYPEFAKYADDLANCIQ